MRTLVRYISAFFAIALVALGLSGQGALAQIAPGVTQSAAHTANITGTVTQSNGTPVAGADVRLTGPAVLSTKTDDHGVFNFRAVPWGVYQVSVSSSLGVASQSNVSLNGDINLAIQYQAQAGYKTIAHISTTSAGVPINVTASSITSLSPSQYAFQGNGHWQDLFAQTPGVAVSGQTYGGFGSTDVSVRGSPLAPVVLSVNGALPYETATTLDGMPLQASQPYGYGQVGGGVNLDGLPINAFDGADVVTGPGANAPSIVDSIGGSVVLHGPAPVNANSFEFSAANDQYGGIVSNARASVRLGRLSATFIYGIGDSPGPLGTTRIMPWLSQTPATIGGQAVHGSFYSEPPAFPPDPTPYPLCYCTIEDSVLYCCVSQSTAWTTHQGAAALSYQLGQSVTAEVFYAGNSYQQNQQGGYYGAAFLPAPGAGYSGSLPPSTPGPGQLTYSLQDSFGPFLQNGSSSLVEEKVTAYLGSGVLRLAALQYNTFNYANVYRSLPDTQYTLWGTACVGAAAANPACPGGGTMTAFNGTPESLTFPGETESVNFWVNNRDLVGSYAVQVGSASSVGVSYLTSYYNEPYNEALTFEGVPIYSASLPSSFSATTNETRVHVETAPSDKLSLGLSWYFAQATYHVQVPSNTNYWTNSVFPYNAPRFGAVWKASPDIAIRASAGGGYALPILNYLTGYGISCGTIGCFEDTANLNLKPETSFGFDVGTDVRLHQNTAVSLDLYRTTLYGQYFNTTSLDGTFGGLPLYVTQTGNLGVSRYEGINLIVHRDVFSGWYWRGTLGFTRAYVMSVPPGFYNNPSVPCTNCSNTTIIPGPNFNGSYDAAVPYASGSGQLGYRWSPGKYFDLQATYFGNNNIYYTPHAFVELNAHAGYAITKNVALQVTFNNATGVYDDGIQHLVTPSSAYPQIRGAPTIFCNATFPIPYGPRAVLFNVQFKY